MPSSTRERAPAEADKMEFKSQFIQLRTSWTRLWLKSFKEKTENSFHLWINRLGNQAKIVCIDFKITTSLPDSNQLQQSSPFSSNLHSNSKINTLSNPFTIHRIMWCTDRLLQCKITCSNPHLRIQLRSNHRALWSVLQISREVRLQWNQLFKSLISWMLWKRTTSTWRTISLRTSSAEWKLWKMTPNPESPASISSRPSRKEKAAPFPA